MGKMRLPTYYYNPPSQPLRYLILSLSVSLLQTVTVSFTSHNTILTIRVSFTFFISLVTKLTTLFLSYPNLIKLTININTIPYPLSFSFLQVRSIIYSIIQFFTSQIYILHVRFNSVFMNFHRLLLY